MCHEDDRVGRTRLEDGRGYKLIRDVQLISYRASARGKKIRCENASVHMQKPEDGRLASITMLMSTSTLPFCRTFLPSKLEIQPRSASRDTRCKFSIH